MHHHTRLDASTQILSDLRNKVWAPSSQHIKYLTITSQWVCGERLLRDLVDRHNDSAALTA